MKTIAQFKHILETTGVPVDDVLAVYPYGSRVYGTARTDSDYDFHLVYADDSTYVIEGDPQYDSADGTISVHVFPASKWKLHIADHKIFALESFSLMDVECLGIDFKLDLPTLRKEFSSKASNSWVKAKKKLTVEENQELIGIKSLFHSFRIPMFGIQIAKHGKIVDFSEANPIWDELKVLDHTKVTWDELYEVYKPRHNALMTEFRKHAEKV